MAAKSKSAFDGWVTLARRTSFTFRWLAFRGEGRLTLVGLALLAALVAGPYLAWNKVGPNLLSSADYQLTPEKISLVPPQSSANWIHGDVRSEALRDAGLERGAPLLDEALCERVAKAFELHPWIRRVHRVTKNYPARADVYVEYRQPAAIVVVGETAWWPVDADGVVLPRDDFSISQARGYPQVTGIASGPFGPTGARWGDARVDGAAKIAAALADDWKRLRLARIAPLVVGASEEGEEDFAFALFTESGRRIYWGYGPDRSKNEPTTEQKIANLRQYAAAHALDREGQDIDLRNPAGPVAVSSR